MTQTPRPLSLADSFELKWDAWNRLVEVKNTGGAWWRATSMTPATGGTDRHYYSERWQVLDQCKIAISINISVRYGLLFRIHWRSGTVEFPSFLEESFFQAALVSVACVKDVRIAMNKLDAIKNVVIVILLSLTIFQFAQNLSLRREARDIYYSMAFQALGEQMMMINYLYGNDLEDSDSFSKDRYVLSTMFACVEHRDALAKDTRREYYKHARRELNPEDKIEFVDMFIHRLFEEPHRFGVESADLDEIRSYDPTLDREATHGGAKN